MSYEYFYEALWIFLSAYNFDYTALLFYFTTPMVQENVLEVLEVRNVFWCIIDMSLIQKSYNIINICFHMWIIYDQMWLETCKRFFTGEVLLVAH